MQAPAISRNNAVVYYAPARFRAGEFETFLT